MNERIIGYILLVLGILIMFVAITQTYLVFTKKIAPPTLFQTSQSQMKQQLPVQGFEGTPVPVTIDPATLLSLTGGEGNMNLMLNLSAYSFLMFLVLSFGSKIASLGVNMLRPINVKLNSNLLEVDSKKNQMTENQPPQTPTKTLA